MRLNLIVLFFTCFFILMSHAAIAQINPVDLMTEVLKKSGEVKSFEADVDIDVDVDFIRIPVKKGRVFFKSPDKFRFRATGFVLVPKKGLNFSVMDMLSKKHTPIYAGNDENNHILKIVPMDESSDFVIATVWIDNTKTRINKMDVTTIGQGNYVMEFHYGNLSYDLPVETKVMFDISQVDIPMKFIGNLKVDQKKAGERSKGVVTLNYSNFKINGDIPDQVFEEVGADTQ
ncbi:MAG: hypothetical protein CVT92_10845 [Bacteroidetes bacterium HGW-Bacteroidetes-1]|nr:MAG: hypothetical protein CVT92_10845 [Bacteroidetes bacterium HGW-Bacteroidetes-1]